MQRSERVLTMGEASGLPRQSAASTIPCRTMLYYIVAITPEAQTVILFVERGCSLEEDQGKLLPSPPKAPSIGLP